MWQTVKQLRTSAWRALSHDVLNTAKAAAYSGMLMLFPAMLVLTALLAFAPATTEIQQEIRTGIEELLPGDTFSVLQGYFQSQHARSMQVVASSALLSVLAAMGVMLTLMEGFRRAYRLPRGQWGFWRSRGTALMLIPISLVPMGCATLIVVFGHQIEVWMIENADHELRLLVILAWRMVRWLIAVATSVAVLAVIYHFGTPRKEHWTNVLPGAITATVLWFPATLAFGWYVTRFVNYSIVYGSLGAGIATLVWLYLVFFAVLIGAEHNALLYREREELGAAVAPTLVENVP